MTEEKSEIEKLYWKAKVLLIKEEGNTVYTVHPFIIDKQINLIKTLINHSFFQKCLALYLSYHPEFSEELAKIINIIWNDLTTSIKSKIRDTLENDNDDVIKIADAMNKFINGQEEV